MLHVMCVALVLVTALAEATALRQWTQQHELAGIQQAAAGAGFQPVYRGRN